MKIIFRMLTVLWVSLLCAQTPQDVLLYNSLEQMRWTGKADPALCRRGLQHDNPRIRLKALAALADTRAAEAVELLLPFLQDENSGMRFEAARGMLCRRDPENAAMMLELEGDPDPRVRVAARCFAANDPQPALETLADADLGGRMAAIGLLGCFHDARIPPLLGTLLADPNDELRSAAAETLRYFPSAGAASALIGRLRMESYYYVQQNMAMAALAMWPESAAAVVEGLRDGRGSRLLWGAARLQDRTLMVVEHILVGLETAPPDWIAAIPQMLKEADAKEASGAVLRRANRKKPAPGERAALLEYLAAAGVPEARDLFRAAATHKDPKVRGNGLWGLGALKDEADMPLLRAGLEHPDAYVRWCSLWALGEVGGWKAAPEARKMLADPDPRVVQTAKDIINLASSPR